MENSSVEKYTDNLLNKLYSLYGEYIKELQIIGTQLEYSPVEVLETFINIEQHRFQQISSIEKVLNTHLKGCSEAFQKKTSARLMSFRIRALKKSRELRTALSLRMKEIRTELSSIRFPGRAKNYRQESVPVLIDIQT